MTAKIVRGKNHGMATTRLYWRWLAMVQRCRNPNNQAFANYGGRGIRVYTEWMNYLAFHKWAMSNGYKEELEIDRRDNDGDYCPSNCRFVTRSANDQNRRSKKRFRGVFIVCRGKKFRATVCHNYKKHDGPCRLLEEEAARDYDRIARHLFGDDAKTNFPRDEAMFETISDDPSIQKAFEEMRRNGESFNVASMLAYQRPPRANDDTTWLTSQSASIGGAFLDGKPEMVQRAYTEPAKAAGVSIKGSVYVPGLAEFPGDPNAWVKNVSEVKNKVEAKGWGCQGAVNVKAREDVEPPPDVDVAPDLIERRALEKIEENPELKMSPELLHEAKEEIKPHWSKT